MKNLFITGVFSIILFFHSMAQVGISKDGSIPDPSSILDVKSSDMGILFPRLSTEARNAIHSPVAGLVIYNTTTNQINYYNGSEWYQIENSQSSMNTGNVNPGGGTSISAFPGSLPDNSAMLDICNSNRGVLIPRTLPELITNPAIGLIIYNSSTNYINYFDGSEWKQLCGSSTGISGSTGRQDVIGATINRDSSYIHQSAILDLSAINKGILIPRLTALQRDLLLPVIGLILYNLTSNSIEFYNGTAWYKLNINIAFPPIPGTNVSSPAKIVWIWNAVPGASGYKWNTTNELTSATDMGINTTKIENNLYCGANYVRYVWAYNSCGITSSSILMQNTMPCLSCDQQYIDTRDAHSYNTVLIGSKCWMKENLNYGTKISGITNQSNNSLFEKYCYLDDDANCTIYGGLYQWDELMQYNPQVGTQGICPSGFHVPSDNEYSYLVNLLGGNATSGGKMKEPGTVHWLSPNTGATNESGFTGLPGGRRRTNGQYENISKRATFWTSTLKGNNRSWSRGLSNDKIDIQLNQDENLIGNSLRCIMDSLSFSFAPSIPKDLEPFDGSKNKSLNTTLSWSCTDPENDPLTFDVYFGNINPPPPLSITQTGTTYNPGLLSYSSLYFWKIVAHDNKGNSAHSPVWSFSTSALWMCGNVLFDTTYSHSYNTVQIGSQCWMAENLNRGTMLVGSVESANNGIIEKHCYNNDAVNCINYGGLYQWDEMMQYTLQQCAQGICPSGWHIPTDGEWCTLSKNIDPSVNCGSTGWIGTDVGTKLKSTTGWSSGGNGTNLSGFNAIPGGYRQSNKNEFFDLLDLAYFWTSTDGGSNNPLIRALASSQSKINRVYSDKNYSVRCLKDFSLNTPSSGLHIPSANQIVWNWSAVQGAAGYRWNTVNDFISAMDLASSTSMSEIGLACNSSYNRFVWAYNECETSGGTILSENTTANPLTPVAGPHFPAVNSIIWKWIPVSGATGYKWGIDDDFNAAIDLGGATQKSEAGLTCNAQYACYVWAYNNCGHSTSAKFIQATNQDMQTPQAHVIPSASSQIIWQWYPVTNASGYRWNTINDFNSAIDIGNITKWTESLLTCGTNYTRYIWAYGICGISSPAALNQTTSVCCPQITDVRDNHVYSTIGIGVQCWMAENLNIGVMINNTSSQTDNGIIEKYCYDDSESNCDRYGGLYGWYEMMNFNTNSSQGICPVGWHVPTNIEWCTLANYIDPSVTCTSTGYLGTNSGYLLKSTESWQSGNGNDQYGFKALASGFRSYGCCFSGLGYESDFRTSLYDLYTGFSYYWSILNANNNIYNASNYYNSWFGYPVRCIKN
jgi:uncharacterized protein (TIGR02145 family)